MRFLRLHVVLADFALNDVIEGRVALERLSVAMAARNAGPAHLGAIRESLRLPLLDAFRHVRDWGEFVEQLRAEHWAIYRALETGDGERAADLTGTHPLGLGPARHRRAVRADVPRAADMSLWGGPGSELGG